MSQPMPEQSSRKTKPEKQEQYIDDLDTSEDRWLTFTDAARITRRQEISIRRWVYAGVLPVRRKSVGVNKRSRQVRLSDLRKLTPIIDLEGAITGAPGRFDLMAIPEQQATILLEHQRLLNDHTTLAHAVQAVQQRLTDQAEQFQQTLDERFQQATAEVQTLRQDYQVQLTEHQASIQAQELAFQTALTTRMETLSNNLHGLIEQLAQESNARLEVQRLLEPRITALEGSLSTLQQEVLAHRQQLGQDLATLKQTIEEQVQTWLDQFAERMEEALNLSVERVDTVQTTQITLSEHIEALRAQAIQASALTQRLEHLETALQQAAEERTTLQARIAALENHQTPDEKVARS